ncbi:hypothetical protein [Micromonospora sp. NPDC051141]|uniref:hypothetical protein n=1 Tax=Micromonospora sp. NPDC051141 TaxID=3364284 RepID=UPI0037A69C2D
MISRVEADRLNDTARLWSGGEKIEQGRRQTRRRRHGSFACNEQRKDRVLAYWAGAVPIRIETIKADGKRACGVLTGPGRFT